jgi:hypothetical protein
MKTNHEKFMAMVRFIAYLPIFILTIIYFPLMWMLGTKNYMDKLNELFNGVLDNYND